MAATETATEAGAIGARIDRLPATRTIWLRMAMLSLGGFFELYDLFLTAYIAPGLVRSEILTATTPGLFGTTGVAAFVAALFSGLFVGAAVFAFVADRFGRRAIFTVSLLWYSAATAVMAFQQDASGLLFWRFVAGVGIGVELVTIDTYLSELMPKRVRGRAFAVNQAIQFCAVPAVALLAWLLVPLDDVAGLEGWRWVVLIGAGGALAVWFIRLGLPESARWLAQHGRVAEAERQVSQLEARVAAESGAPLPAPEPAVGEAPRGRFADIWRGPYLARTLMLIVFNVFQTVGYYGFANWAPTLLVEKGVTVVKSLQYTFLIAIAAPLGPLLAAFLADRTERKWQLVCAAGAIAVFGLVFAHLTDAAWLVVFGVLLTVANNVMSYSFHAYQAELYPTRIRALGVGFTYSWSRLSAVFTAFVIAYLLHGYGAPAVFVLIAGSMVVVMLAIGVLGPRTRNRALEEISR